MNVRSHAHPHISVKSGARIVQGLAGILRSRAAGAHSATTSRARLGIPRLPGRLVLDPGEAVENALIYGDVRHGRM